MSEKDNDFLDNINYNFYNDGNCNGCIYFIPNWEYCELDSVFNENSKFIPMYEGKSCEKWSDIK